MLGKPLLVLIALKDWVRDGATEAQRGLRPMRRGVVARRVRRAAKR